MAWSVEQVIGSAQSKTDATTISITTAAAANVGNVVVVVVAINNTNTTDGETSEVSSITDSAGGNTWIKAGEYCNSQAAAAAGATVSVWYSLIAQEIASSGTITANLANSIVAKAISAQEFALAVGATVQVLGLQVAAADAVDFPSMTISGLANSEYLFIRGMAMEDAGSGNNTATSGYTNFQNSQTSGGSGPSNMRCRGEFIITTGTGSTSDPTAANPGDNANVFFALQEIVATDPIPPLLPRFNGMNTLIRM